MKSLIIVFAVVYVVSLPVVFVMGVGLGRAFASEIDEEILLIADAIDDLASTTDRAAEVRRTEQEAFGLYIEMIDAEIQALSVLKAEFSTVSAEMDTAIAAAQIARRAIVLIVDTAKSDWETYEQDAERLRDLAETVRELVD